MNTGRLVSTATLIFCAAAAVRGQSAAEILSRTNAMHDRADPRAAADVLGSVLDGSFDPLLVDAWLDAELATTIFEGPAAAGREGRRAARFDRLPKEARDATSARARKFALDVATSAVANASTGPAAALERLDDADPSVEEFAAYHVVLAESLRRRSTSPNAAIDAARIAVAYDRASTLDPSALWIRFRRATHRAESGRKREALADCDAILARSDDFYPAWILRSDLRATTDRRGAAADLERALALRREAPEIWRRKAELSLAAGAFFEALQQARHAVRLAESDADALDVLLRCEAANGRHDEAWYVAEDAVERAPDAFLARYLPPSAPPPESDEAKTRVVCAGAYARVGKKAPPTAPTVPRPPARRPEIAKADAAPRRPSAVDAYVRGSTDVATPNAPGARGHGRRNTGGAPPREIARRPPTRATAPVVVRNASQKHVDVRVAAILDGHGRWTAACTEWFAAPAGSSISITTTSAVGRREPLVASGVALHVACDGRAAAYVFEGDAGRPGSPVLTNDDLLALPARAEANYRSALLKIAGAVVVDLAGGAAVRNSESVGEALIVGIFALGLRNGLVDSALYDAFPSWPAAARSCLAAIVARIIDGDLDWRRLVLDAGVDRLASYLDSEYPGLRGRYDAARFLVDLGALLAGRGR
jgi:tetratricopeptide (TPR) repeat protein